MSQLLTTARISGVLGEEELIVEFAERIRYLYEELQRLGYLS